MKNQAEINKSDDVFLDVAQMATTRALVMQETLTRAQAECTALRLENRAFLDLIKTLRRSVRDAELPADYQWGREALESFNFGKKRALMAFEDTLRAFKEQEKGER